jgi:hypothetical protein
MSTPPPPPLTMNLLPPPVGVSTCQGTVTTMPDLLGLTSTASGAPIPSACCTVRHEGNNKVNGPHLHHHGFSNFEPSPVN